MTIQEEKEIEHGTTSSRQRTRNCLLCFHWDHLGDYDHGTKDWQMVTVMNFTVDVCVQIMLRDKHQNLCWTLKNSRGIQLIFFFCFFHPVLELLNNGILVNSLMLDFLLFFFPQKIYVEWIKELSWISGTTTAAKGCI